MAATITSSNSSELSINERDPLIGQAEGGAGVTSTRGTRVRLITVLCILVTELCERLTFYGVSANLVLYCQDVLKLQAPYPSTVTLAFQGTTFFTPVIGGWLADRFMGRFNAIYGSSMLYFVGVSLLCAVSYNYGPTYGMNITAKEGFLAIAMILIAAGTGGIKSNVSPLGAEQLQDQGSQVVERFFDWFYWFVQLGGFIAFTLVVYVQQEISFFYGYLIPSLAILLGIFFFLIGNRIGYVDSSPSSDSRALDTIKIAWHGLVGVFKSKSEDERSINWLDRVRLVHKERWSRESVEDTRSVLRLMPIFLTFVLYWTVFGQGLTTYVIQAKNMRLKLGSFTVPAASLNVFETGSLLIILPLLDHGIYPLLRYFGFRVTPLQRIGVGMLCASGSVFVAGFVEIGRKKFIDEYGYIQQVLFDKTVNASSMNVFYQAPQYILQGAGEALVSVTGLEMAFTQSPEYLHGLIMGLCLGTIGLGYYLASALAAIVTSASTTWYPTDNINSGHLEYYLFLMSGLMMLNFFIFVAISICFFEYKEVKETEKEPQNAEHPREGNESTSPFGGGGGDLR
uniref:Solute carrier family 15 member 4-like n=1 Tax=Actinia tenebrosa TaxID=6105 RepID=A0A6P8I6K6_ACTTE